MTTAFVWHEHYMWHDTGNYAGLFAPGLGIQPGLHFENAETKRRLRNLLDVSGLAEQLHVSKPVITRALNKLSALGYLRRERDAADRRNIFITRTSKGAEFLDAFHHFIAGTARDDRPDQHHAERTA